MNNKELELSAKHDLELNILLDSCNTQEELISLFFEWKRINDYFLVQGKFYAAIDAANFCLRIRDKLFSIQ